MKNGSYWIFDGGRYGWEVVRVIGSKFYRFGMDQEFDVSAFELDGLEFIPIEPPK